LFDFHLWLRLLEYKKFSLSSLYLNPTDKKVELDELGYASL
jgi:hypothetical protein